MQTSLFDTTLYTTSKNPVQNTLIISSQRHQQLNKQQQAFNKLIKKIEKLRLELKETAANLDAKLEYYGKYIHPLEQVLITRRKEYVKLLFLFYSGKNVLMKQQKNILKELLLRQLEEVFAIDEHGPDEELAKIYKKVKGVSYEDAAISDFEVAKDELEAMFEDVGFDLNLEDFNPEEIMDEMRRLQDDFLKQQENLNSKKASRKTTAKQLEKEKREQQLEEARNKNISSVYKQLAKALHPDLEQDENIKSEKEALMKQLTVAYNNNDLYSLLSLEMEWIHKEEQHTDKLSNEKLAIYNKVLREQVQELEQNKFSMMIDPRFQVLLRYAEFVGIEEVDLPHQKKHLEEVIRIMKERISQLKGNEALQAVRKIIHPYN